MRHTTLILLVLLTATPLAADRGAEADAAYAAQQWRAAEQLYAEVVRESPADGRAWYRLAVSRHMLGSIDTAIEAYMRATEAKFSPAYTSYGLAAAYAKKGGAAASCEWLDAAMKAGFRDEASFLADEDFASIRTEACVVSFTERFRKALHPCHEPRFRALDFWLGEWDVRDSRAGHPVGSSSITQLHDKCVVFETWTGGRGGTGSSFNTIDPATGAWRQTWADSSGRIYDFTGEPGEGRMVYERVTTDPDGKPLRIRLTLSKLATGEVRQLSEQSTDDGKSWTIGYDFTYRTKGAK